MNLGRTTQIFMLERYKKMLKAGETPRYTDQTHHDTVAFELPKNADVVFQLGKADHFKVYNQEGLIFDKDNMPNQLLSTVINHELHSL